MIKQGKSATNHKIDRKWVKEDKRSFSKYPGIPNNGVPGEEEIWLELIEFYCDDLKWLLSLEHHKFWSHMIYSEKPHQLLISFLKSYPPSFVKKKLSLRESVINKLTEVEKLVFLVFLRLSTEKESESCYIQNIGEVIYNNYLFTVPVILDICSIYGTSNFDLVKKMINNVITAAPDFLDDFQEIIPHFVSHVLKTIKDKFSSQLDDSTAEDLVLYLYDSVSTIQVFFELYPNICQLFSKNEFIKDIVCFYSNILPHCCKKNVDLINNVRIDMLRIVKSIFDFVLNEANEIIRKKEEFINEYLTLMTILLNEPVFLLDYNLIYSIEFELRCAIKNCQNVDRVKVNCILDGIESEISKDEAKVQDCGETNDSEVQLVSLITEVKDIFPHLGEDLIQKYLNYYDNSTEKVIAAVLENIIPPDVEKPTLVEFKGKHKIKHENLSEMLNDKEEISEVKERYVGWSLVDDKTYDDEYDDTYDENIDVLERGEEEIGRRPFVVPRILRNKGESEEEEDEEEEEKEEEEDEDVEENPRNQFVENPAVVRERLEQKRWESSVRNVRGKARGRGQINLVFRNREFKEFHKSSIANHNRKKEAARKINRGMIHS